MRTPTGARYDRVHDDTDAIEGAICQAAGSLNPDDRRVFIAGPAVITRPIVVPQYVSLYGAGAERWTTPAHPTLIASPGFEGPAMILMQAPAGGETFGPQLHSLGLDGCPARQAGKVFSGVRAEGAVRAVVMRDVSIWNTGDRGVQTVFVGARAPFSWQCENVQVMHCRNDGFRLAGMTDATWRDCRAIGAGRHGWWIDGAPNSKWIGCRSEWSAGEGWNIAGGWGTGTGSGGASWIDCSTDRNGGNGVFVSAVGSAALSFTDLDLRRDGRFGKPGGNAGLRVTSAECPVTVDNVRVFPGVDDDGKGLMAPEVGVWGQGSAFLSVNSGYVHGARVAIDVVGERVWVGPGVGRATGPTDAPVRA